MGLRKTKSILDQASDTVTDYVEQVRTELEAAVASARDKAAPGIAAGAAIAAEKIASGASIAAERAAAAAEAAADKVAEVADPPKKKHRLRKVLIITGIAAGAAYVATKLRSGQESDAWQSSYTPTPAPRPAPTPARSEQDEGGASVTEALSDQADAPHAVTTPDDPADVVEVDDKP